MPTDKQEKTLQVLIQNPKMPLGEAMKEGGYTDLSATHPKQNFIDRVGTQSLMEEWKEQLTSVGITKKFMADKYKEWLTAKKPFSSHTEPDKMVPDYQTQTKAGEFVRSDWGLSKEELNINAEKVLVIPSELIERYGITFNPINRSEGQT